MRGIARACGAATIINAIAMGNGGAFAIDLMVEAEVTLTNEAGIIIAEIEGEDESTHLIENCVKKALSYTRSEEEYGAKVVTRSDIPIARGLKSSSAASNAVVLATLSALDVSLDDMKILELGVDASIEAKVTITGAFDDASASLLGGAVLTDNRSRKILRRMEMDEYEVLIHVPTRKSYTIEADVDMMRSVSDEVEVAFQEALKGNIYVAINLNGFLYAPLLGINQSLALRAIKKGAIASSVTGTGPSIFALVSPEKIDEMKDEWSDENLIHTRVNNRGAEVIR